MEQKPIHKLARRQAYAFISLLWDELPEAWHTDMDGAAFDLELWLACFEVKLEKNKPSDDFHLLRMIRRRAESYYRNELKQPHHTPIVWAMFRFRLEYAQLRTIGASNSVIEHCYAWHDLTAGFAHRIDYYGRERPEYLIDPSSETPF